MLVNPLSSILIFPEMRESNLNSFIMSFRSSHHPTSLFRLRHSFISLQKSWRAIKKKYINCRFHYKKQNYFCVSRITTWSGVRRNSCDGRGKFISFKSWIIISGTREIESTESEKFITKSSTLTQTNRINQKINCLRLECDKVESSFRRLEGFHVCNKSMTCACYTSSLSLSWVPY